MNSNNLRVDLDGRFDKKDNLYYIGRLAVPIYIDLTGGITLLVFLSESGDEELQIAVNNKENTTFSRITKKRDRLEIPLDVRTDQHGKKFYVAKIHMNGNIKCHEGIVFLIFISREGSEEIQIVSSSGNIISTEKHSAPRGVEVIRKRVYSSD